MPEKIQVNLNFRHIKFRKDVSYYNHFQSNAFNLCWVGENLGLHLVMFSAYSRLCAHLQLLTVLRVLSIALDIVLGVKPYLYKACSFTPVLSL